MYNKILTIFKSNFFDLKLLLLYNDMNTAGYLMYKEEKKIAGVN